MVQSGKPENFKIVLIGDKFVGKTSIARRFANNTYSSNYEGTVGASFFSKSVHITDVAIL